MADDLLDLDPGIRESPTFQFIRGGFMLGDTAVPFFSTCVQARELNQIVQLPSQLPVDPQQPIKIEELFQRDLDEDRIRTRIVPYLEDAQKLRFFNALTVVLLPLQTDRRRLADAYPADDALAPDGPEELTNVKVGPVTLSYRGDNRRVGRLRWNADLTAPVVLDGQHRYRAMQKVLDGTGRLSQELAESEVSVLFLVLDERAGFAPPSPMTVLGACRQIFIDLNQYAKQVTRARLALLDDRRVNSTALQAILSPAVEVTNKPVHDRVAETGRLPLTLVSWRATDRQGETAKFDTGPYITSLLTLQDIVDHVLGVGTFTPLDHDRAGTIVDQLAARLDLENDPGFDLAQRQEEIKAAADEERPFDLPAEAVRTAGEAFRERFGPRIVKPLTGLIPYAALIDALTEAGVLSTDLEPWLAFNVDERRGLLTSLQAEDPKPKVDTAATAVKRERYPLAFQVVFQKASIYSLNSMLDRHAAVAAHWGLSEASEATVLDQWMERFNRYLAPALAIEGTESPFYGAGIRPGGIIDFRKTRIRTITGFVSYCMLADLPRWLELAEDRKTLRDQTMGFVTDGWGKIRAGRHEPLSGLYSLHGRNWRASVEELVATTAEIEDDPDDTKRQAATLAHAGWQLRRVVEVAAAA
jgi:hypothetical protein